MIRKTSLTIFLGFIFLIFNYTYVNAAPYLATNYFCLIDKDSGQVLYEKGQDELRAVASTTKMMTAILVAEYAKPNDLAIVSIKAAKTPAYSIGLKAGQEIEVDELLKASLIRSANDAAVVLAEHVASDEKFFAYLMTKKAFAIGAVNTNFTNASGLPNDEHYSTAYDLTVIGSYLLNQEKLQKIVATPKTTFAHPSYRIPLDIINTNKLLGNYSGANGIKTGTTNLAGNCLVASAKRQDKNLIAVVLKSHDRTGDCRRLLDYGFNNTKYIKVIDRKTAFKTLNVNNAIKPFIELFPGKDLYLWEVGDGVSIEKRVRLNYLIEAPIKKGQKLGHIDIYVNNKFFSTIPLISMEDNYKKSNIYQWLKENLFY
ncbi:MAG: D-alanyl-D-alanine carboxypeptidase [Syntrophomonadaceae bacterium]|nr:D-alanyl-D-alanine carboxypeptidase [Syntrophomonadaceae bacterium]